jgi:hypothetical protein
MSYKKDFWYLFYSLSNLKNEFYAINRDVLISERKWTLPNEHDDTMNSYYFVENYGDGDLNDNIKTNIIVNGITGTEEERFSFSFWKKWIPNHNERTNNLIYKLGYSEDMFKPYYRYMIPLLILRTYNTFLINLGYKKYHLLNNLISKYDEKRIRNNMYVLFNFVVVKILLDLFNYSYRSLIRISSHSNIHFLNKVKNYLGKLKRITYLNWSSTVKRIRSLRKTTNYITFRYTGLAKNFYKQIEFNVGLTTKREILRSFVFYFEDLLYIIYGKWVIIRIWPLRKYILSSYILTKRIALLIQWRKAFVSNNNMYRKVVLRLIDGIKRGYLRKGYDTYLENNKRWPSNLLMNFKDEKGLNYANLEYYDNKEERNYLFNTYVMDTRSFNSLTYIKNKLDNTYLFFNKYGNFKGKYKDEYLSILYKNDPTMYHRMNKIVKASQLFSVMYLSIIKNTDISGIKFRVKGRPHFSRSIQRSYYRSSVFGDLGLPGYYSKRLLKPVAPFIPLYRGCIKANVDSNSRVIITRNGTMSIKIWIVSYMSADIEELLLHLLRIKELFTILSRRYIKIRNNYLPYLIEEFNPYYTELIEGRKKEDYNNNKLE